MPTGNTQFLPWLFVLTFLCLLLAVQHRLDGGVLGSSDDQKIQNRRGKLEMANSFESEKVASTAQLTPKTTLKTTSESPSTATLKATFEPILPKTTTQQILKATDPGIPKDHSNSDDSDEKNIFYSPPPRGQLNQVQLPKRAPIPHKIFTEPTQFGYQPKLISPEDSLLNAPSLDCEEKRFADNFPVAAIHAFRGAGNAWSRSLIEEATGFWTGSTYNDDELYVMGLRGEIVDQSAFEKVIGVSSHTITESPREQRLFEKVRNNDKSKCVIIIRNPFDTFVAQFVHLTTGGRHVGGKPQSWDPIQASRNFRQLGEVKNWYWGGLGYWNFTDEKNFKPKGGYTGTWFRSYYNAFNQCNNRTDGKNKSVLVVTFESLINDRVETGLV